jgi:2-amino-4-hydroxy-6-hydroxymethyldihydropteridine diphosphokinase
MQHLALLSLGSNIENRESHLRDAIARLADWGEIRAVSSFYETEPVEFTDQAWFLNCAASLETAEEPDRLMAALLSIEETMGRRRVQTKGPRIIDIDILLFDDLVIDSIVLTIPHPAMDRRRFVLEPLAEIAADARHPLLNKSVGQLLDDLPAGQSVRRIDG